MSLINIIEFAENEARVVQAERGKNRRAVRAAFTFDLPRDDDPAKQIDARAGALRDAVKSAKLKLGHVRLLIPKNFVMVRKVTLPSISNEEIAGMARFEAERHIPVNAERHVISHHILRKQGVEGSEVLLAAVDQPVVSEFVNVCIKAGVGVEEVGVSSLGVFNALAAEKPKELADRVVALAFIGGSSADIVIAQNGTFVFARGTSAGTARLYAELEEAGVAPRDRPADGSSRLRRLVTRRILRPIGGHHGGRDGEFHGGRPRQRQFGGPGTVCIRFRGVPVSPAHARSRPAPPQ